jgi:hypothetical protein
MEHGIKRIGTKIAIEYSVLTDAQKVALIDVLDKENIVFEAIEESLTEETI